MSGLLCAMCVSNYGPDAAHAAGTVLGGIAVCLDPENEDGTGAHFHAAWLLIGGETREAIANADGLSIVNPNGRAE